MLIPIRHENMSARRWPVVTFALIAINLAVFLATFQTLQDDIKQLGDQVAGVLDFSIALQRQLSFNLLVRFLLEARVAQSQASQRTEKQNRQRGPSERHRLTGQTVNRKRSPSPANRAIASRLRP
jgi:hypothetical protein